MSAVAVTEGVLSVEDAHRAVRELMDAGVLQRRACDVTGLSMDAFVTNVSEWITQTQKLARSIEAGISASALRLAV